MFLLRLIELLELNDNRLNYKTLSFYYQCGRVQNYNHFYRYFFNQELIAKQLKY